MKKQKTSKIWITITIIFLILLFLIISLFLISFKKKEIIGLHTFSVTFYENNKANDKFHNVQIKDEIDPKLDDNTYYITTTSSSLYDGLNELDDENENIILNWNNDLTFGHYLSSVTLNGMTYTSNSNSYWLIYEDYQMTKVGVDYIETKEDDNFQLVWVNNL